MAPQTGLVSSNIFLLRLQGMDQSLVIPQRKDVGSKEQALFNANLQIEVFSMPCKQAPPFFEIGKIADFADLLKALPRAIDDWSFFLQARRPSKDLKMEMRTAEAKSTCEGFGPVYFLPLICFFFERDVGSNLNKDFKLLTKGCSCIV
jgi:hypothetical protein